MVIPPAEGRKALKASDRARRALPRHFEASRRRPPHERNGHPSLPVRLLALRRFLPRSPLLEAEARARASNPWPSWQNQLSRELRKSLPSGVRLLGGQMYVRETAGPTWPSVLVIRFAFRRGGEALLLISGERRAVEVEPAQAGPWRAFCDWLERKRGIHPPELARLEDFWPAR